MLLHLSDSIEMIEVNKAEESKDLSKKELELITGTRLEGEVIKVQDGANFSLFRDANRKSWTIKSSNKNELKVVK